MSMLFTKYVKNVLVVWILALVSKYFTLNPGDVIMTGTPAGARNAVVQPGDEVIVKIERIGCLKNSIIKQ